MDSRIQAMIADLYNQLKEAIARGDSAEEKRLTQLLDQTMKQITGRQ